MLAPKCPLFTGTPFFYTYPDLFKAKTCPILISKQIL